MKYCTIDKKKIKYNEESQVEWEDYLGKIYSSIIKNTNNKELKTIVEIAPGYKYKIANALKDIEFNGDLYVIDCNKEAVAFLRKKYHDILPNAKIHFLEKTLFEAIEFLPNNIDIICSNHCLDDMIINEYMKNENMFLNNKNNKELIIKNWNELKNNSDSLNMINSKIINCFKLLFSRKKVNEIILSQYMSNGFFDDFNSQMIYDITRNLFNQLKELFVINEDIQNILSNINFSKKYKYIYLNDIKLQQNIHNAENWIVGEYKDE